MTLTAQTYAGCTQSQPAFPPPTLVLKHAALLPPALLKAPAVQSLGCCAIACLRSGGLLYAWLQQGGGLTDQAMLQILQRGQEVSKQNWELLRVAVVDLQEYVFLGRLFFGDAATGEQVWDCDCRPSDACWLALRVRARPSAPALLRLSRNPGSRMQGQMRLRDIKCLLTCSQKPAALPWWARVVAVHLCYSNAIPSSSPAGLQCCRLAR